MQYVDKKKGKRIEYGLRDNNGGLRSTNSSSKKQNKGALYYPNFAQTITTKIPQ